MAQRVENLSQLEIKDSPLDMRFERLVIGLSPFFQEPDLVVEYEEDGEGQNGHNLDMGNYKTPVLSAGEQSIQFLAFLPKPDSGLYSPSILCHLGDSEVYLRQNRLVEPDKAWRPDEPTARESLEELESLVKAYGEVACQLTAKQARLLEFPGTFVKRQTKVRRAGRSVARSLRLVGN